MELRKVNLQKDAEFLYEMLKERDDSINISHSTLPSFEDHFTFIAEEPYKYWFIINVIGEYMEHRVGNIYLTHNNELGIFILKKYQRNGYAIKALRMIIEQTKEKYYLANINPKNKPSIMLFAKLNFEHIQNTYKLTI
jgi:RimJ/RimL family protein N-acetyltransferase